MHLAKLTMTKFLPVLFVACGLQLTSNAQEISPYSRYGLGDISPNRNILSRGMGGLAAGTMDYQSINFTNPAALGGIYNTIFDIGTEVDVRTLRQTNPASKFTSNNALFSYLQLGFPLTTKKMLKKDINWGMTFGLRPVSRIDYNIEKRERLTGVDSLFTLYNGTGGINQIFAGTGFQINEGTGFNKKVYRFGVNFGYMFGTKDYSTKIILVNDTVDYYRSNSENNTHFGGMFIQGGFQFEDSIRLGSKKGNLRLGLYGNVQQRLNAKQDILRETFSFDANGNAYRVDSIQDQKDVKGTIVFPSTIGVGFTYSGPNWTYGADLEFTNWANYTFYRQTDAVQNSWVVRVGTEYFPATKKTSAKKYFSFVRYRAGIFYGPDYVKVTANRPNYGVTLGASLPLMRRVGYGGEWVVLHTGIEIGGRGDKNVNVRENIMKYTVGISMNARWFQKRKYD